MDPEEKEKMEKRDWLAEKIQMLNTQLEGFEADVEKAVSTAVHRSSIRLVSFVSSCNQLFGIRRRCYICMGVIVWGVINMMPFHVTVRCLRDVFRSRCARVLFVRSANDFLTKPPTRRAGHPAAFCVCCRPDNPLRCSWPCML